MRVCPTQTSNVETDRTPPPFIRYPDRLRIRQKSSVRESYYEWKTILCCEKNIRQRRLCFNLGKLNLMRFTVHTESTFESTKINTPSHLTIQNPQWLPENSQVKPGSPLHILLHKVEFNILDNFYSSSGIMGILRNSPTLYPIYFLTSALKYVLLQHAPRFSCCFPSFMILVGAFAVVLYYRTNQSRLNSHRLGAGS